MVYNIYILFNFALTNILFIRAGDAHSFGHKAPSHLGPTYDLLVAKNPFLKRVMVFPDLALQTWYFLQFAY